MTEQTLAIAVAGSLADANRVLSELIQCLVDTNPSATAHRRREDSLNQDIGSIVEIFASEWLPAALGAAVGQWAAMRPTTEVTITRKTGADNSTEVSYQGPARNINEEIISDLFKAP